MLRNCGDWGRSVDGGVRGGNVAFSLSRASGDRLGRRVGVRSFFSSWPAELRVIVRCQSSTVICLPAYGGSPYASTDLSALPVDAYGLRFPPVVPFSPSSQQRHRTRRREGRGRPSRRGSCRAFCQRKEDDQQWNGSRSRSFGAQYVDLVVSKAPKTARSAMAFLFWRVWTSASSVEPLRPDRL